MELKDAIQLITHTEFSTLGKLRWIDLGCGSGTFTLALASILEKGSVIYAVDTNQSALNKIPQSFNQIIIHKQKLDFVNDKISIDKPDGVLMANSLHFVKEKESFLNKIKQGLADNASFLIIEYDSDSANPWVPYPLSFESLKMLFSKAGYAHIIRLNSRPSIYGNRNIYAALVY